MTVFVEFFSEMSRFVFDIGNLFWIGIRNQIGDGRVLLYFSLVIFKLDDRVDRKHVRRIFLEKLGRLGSSL